MICAATSNCCRTSFVVLLAYDCQSLLRDKKETLLWETRFSMNEHRNQFDAQLKPMVLAASAYFGRDSLGLVRDPVPEGHVEIGDVKSLGALPDPNTTAAPPRTGRMWPILRTAKTAVSLRLRT